MRKQKTKKKNLIAITAACLGMMITTVPAAAASEYTVTIRPGGIARFSEDFLGQYEAIGAEITQKTGSIKVKVPVGHTIPYVPTENDMVYESEAQGRYVMSTDWYNAESVTENMDMIVKYDALVNGVEYMVRYVDAQSGEDVSTPVIAQGNMGDTYTYYRKEVENYSCQTASQRMTLGADADENVLTFQYTSTLEDIVNEEVIPGTTTTETQTVPGGTNVVTNEVVVPGTTTTTVTTPGGTTGGTTTGGTTTEGTTTEGTTTGTTEGTAAEGTTEGTTTEGTTGTEGAEEIPDEQVPLGQQDLEENVPAEGEDTSAQGEGTEGAEEIPDEEVPMGQQDLQESKSGSKAVPIAVGVAAILGAAGAGVYYFRRKIFK